MPRQPDWSRCTEAELWRYVAVHLARHGIDSVLSGGAVVAIYAPGHYSTGDLDFIIPDRARQQIESVLASIGFRREKSHRSGRHFIHPECERLYLEFPNGPLAIGDDYHITPCTESVEGQLIRILYPTDCICDRLTSFIHWGVRDTLEQAVLVAQAQPCDMARIGR